MNKKYTISLAIVLIFSNVIGANQLNLVQKIELEEFIQEIGSLSPDDIERITNDQEMVTALAEALRPKHLSQFKKKRSTLSLPTQSAAFANMIMDLAIKY